MSKCRCGHDATDEDFKIEPISQHTLKVPVQYKGQAEPLDFTEPDATARARAWLEANTPLRWVDEPDPECLDEPLEALNRRPQIYAERMVAFLESETPRIKADAVREFVDRVENKVLVCCEDFLIHYEDGNEASMGYPVVTGQERCGCPEPSRDWHEVMREIAKEMTEED